jgi:hypothetical protein
MTKGPFRSFEAVRGAKPTMLAPQAVELIDSPLVTAYVHCSKKWCFSVTKWER